MRLLPNDFQPPGSDPNVDYGEMPPQFDNPFDVNDYEDYDYNSYEYVVRPDEPKEKPKYNERRRPPPGGLAPVPPREPAGPPAAPVTRHLV